MERASQVAHRRGGQLAILIVKAQEAFASGVVFHSPEPSYYLVKALPARFIIFPERDEDGKS